MSGCCEGEGLVSDYLHLAGPAAAQDIIAEITASVPGPPFMVGTAVNFTCNAVNTTTNTTLPATYQWRCLSCFLIGFMRMTTKTVSTIGVSEVDTLTPSGTEITCDAMVAGQVVPSTAIFNIALTGKQDILSMVLYALLPIGFAVYNQDTLEAVQNNSFFIANSTGHFNVRLVCMTAMGSVEWEDPEEMFVMETENEPLNEISVDYTALGISRLVQNQLINVGPFEEGYYRCVQLDLQQYIRVGLFQNERGTINNAIINFCKIHVRLYHSEPPVFVPPLLTDMPLALGSSASLQCNATGDSVPTITWRYNGTVITQSDPLYTINTTSTSTYSISTLLIPTVDSTTVGSYSCEAVNMITSVSSTSSVYPT